MSNTIRVTERSTFKLCRRKWDYQVNKNLVPKDRNSGALWFGTGMHRVLEFYYRNKMNGIETGVNELFGIWADYCEETPIIPDEMHIQLRNDETALAINMIDIYYSYAKAHDDFKVLAVEQKLFAKDYPLSGTIDMIIENGDGMWIVDHKNLKTFATTEDLELDDQMTAYIWLARQNGYNVRGALYNMIRKKVPAQPELLKNGKQLSVNKSIDTTYDIYLKALRDYDFDPEDERYTDILETLKNNDFVKREKVIRTKGYLESFEEQLPLEIEDMKSPRVYPCFGKHCSFFCSFTSLCSCEQDKGNSELVRDMYYEEGNPDERR